MSNTVGCADDLIESGRTGYQYPVGDVGALATAIKALLPIAASDDVMQALEQKMREYSLDRATAGILAASHYGHRH